MRISFIILPAAFIAFGIGASATSQERASTGTVLMEARTAEATLKKFQRAYRQQRTGGRSLPLASISVSEDCSAETTCPNGTTLECSIAGPTTSCHSDASGVACFQSHSDGSVTGSSGTC
ncbi:MAG: hypothetical protein WA979_01985 [Pacificimonas sp.]